MPRSTLIPKVDGVEDVLPLKTLAGSIYELITKALIDQLCEVNGFVVYILSRSIVERVVTVKSSMKFLPRMSVFTREWERKGQEYYSG